MMDRFCVLTELHGGVKFLEQNGYVVFSDVLDAQQISHAKDLLWDYLEKELLDEDCPPLRRDDPITWTADWPGSPHTGIITSNGIGQSQFLWFLRGNEQIRKVFSKIWDTEDLITSFDGANTFRPWDTNPRLKTEGGWYHVDQNAAVSPNKESVQGLVSLYDATCGTGGLTVVPGSHLKFQEFSARAGVHAGTSDFVTIRKTDPVFEGNPTKLVTCKAGDLCLWDSRTIHCNTPGGTFTSEQEVEGGTGVAGRAQFDGELLRAVGYVCMTPRSFASAQDLVLRKTLVAQGATTSHWPHKNLERPLVGYTMKMPPELDTQQLALI
eukprot:TRINITY_DN24392_c0_g1_i1.p1 TRINITY_DN24392_c0_g1~~TRINITY_DN24392_c0_g1_i1.p1  ORF type:complete len:324 (-),score=24.44 TRINITY_DN24392_c0_g1_i1:435-1406(-)